KAPMTATLAASVDPNRSTKRPGSCASPRSVLVTCLPVVRTRFATTRRPHGVNQTSPATTATTSTATATSLAFGSENAVSELDPAHTANNTSTTTWQIPLARLVRPTP